MGGHGCSLDGLQPALVVPFAERRPRGRGLGLRSRPRPSNSVSETKGPTRNASSRAQEDSRFAQGRIPGGALLWALGLDEACLGIRGTTLLRTAMTAARALRRCRRPTVALTCRDKPAKDMRALLARELRSRSPPKGLPAFHGDGSGGVFAVLPSRGLSIAFRAPCDRVFRLLVSVYTLVKKVR